MIVTERLELVPGTHELLHAEIAGHEALAAVLVARVPLDWPPELYDRDAIDYTLARLDEGPEQAGWLLYYTVLKEAGTGAPRTVIGTCGYKGPPDGKGSVEIGYGILPAYRRRGLATEASRALIARAFARPEVTRVIAETLPHLLPSIGVLTKLGFRFVGPGSEEGVVRYAFDRA